MVFWGIERGFGTFYPPKSDRRAQYSVKMLEERVIKEKAKRDEAWKKFSC